MQRDRLIKLCLSLLIGVGLFLVSKGEVQALIRCRDIGADCGFAYPNCWDEYCSSSCTYGCSREDCDGGRCSPPPDCSECGTYPNCYDKWCTSSCVYGCWRDTCWGGSCNSPPPPDCSECGTYPDCYDEYCTSSCDYGCSRDTCWGGSCNPSPAECVNGRTKCENGEYSLCVDDNWEEQYDCYIGCDASGESCSYTAYCEDSECGTCDKDVPPDGVNDAGYYTVRCWSSPDKLGDGTSYCVRGDNCVEEECHPIISTCGGALTEERCNELYPGMGYVSHIDNCGGLDCGPSCSGGGGGGDDCNFEYPSKPTLTSPTDGGVVGMSVSLSWQESGYGVGCPQSNSQDLYLEAGDSSPDVKIADLSSGVSSYDVSGLNSGTLYYWRVVANNGDLSMSSDVFSFNVNGLIEGYFFDSGGMGVCPADLSDPVYDSRKIGGGMMDITSGGDSYLDVTSVADGSYSQAVTIPGSYVLGNFRLGSGFVSSPDLVCDGSSVDFVVGGAGTAVRSFGFLRDYDGWWQAVGGDVYGGLGIESVIPASCVGACEAYLIKADIDGESGLVRYLSGGVDLGDNENASVGPDGWVVSSGYTGQNTSYAYYTSKMALLEKTSWAGNGKPVFNPEVGSDYEIYVYTGTAVIDFDVAADEKMIFMVGGDVDVSSNVDVAEGGHLAVIASGRITFANDVSQVEGWWVGDSLSIESTGDEGTEVVFRGEGSFIGWNGVSLNRDRGGLNATEPAEEFVFRPDLMINAPIALKFSRYVWQEKAPQ